MRKLKPNERVFNLIKKAGRVIGTDDPRRWWAKRRCPLLWMQFTCPVIKEQKNRLNLQSVKTEELPLLSKSYTKHWLKLQGVNWNEFQKGNSWQNYALFWPYFYDPPSPDRPLIQTNSPLMATRVQAWDHHWASETWNFTHTTNIKRKVFRRKLRVSASSDYAGAMNIQQQNLNTVKSLLRQLFVKRSLRKLNQITKKRVTSIIEWKTPSDHWRKWVGEGRVVTVHMWNKCPG